MIRRPPRSTPLYSSAASDVYKRQDMDTYNDQDFEEARIGYIGRINYSYGNKYYLEVSGREDGAWKFASDKRWGFFPSMSLGWRISQEPFAKALLGASSFDLKLRGSYG